MNKLIFGDCLEKMQQIPDDSINLILCDLPYGTTKCKWDSTISLDKLWSQYKRILNKESGVVVLFADQPFTSLLVTSNLNWFKYEFIWKKDKTTGYLNANYRPMKCSEDILIFSPANASPSSKNKSNMTYNPQGLIPKKVIKKNSEKRIGKMLNQKHHLGKNQILSDTEYTQEFTNYPIEIIEFKHENDTQHPTQKPVAICEYLIKTFSNEGEIVLDNCMGSGTTGLACKKTNRRFIGIENEKKYFEIAETRLSNLCFQSSLF